VGDGGEVLGRLGVEVGEGVLQQAVAHPPAKTQSYSQYLRSTSSRGKVKNSWISSSMTWKGFVRNMWRCEKSS
jgi:hypothetical protein